MLMINSNINKRFVKAVTANIVKFAVFGLATTALLAFIIVSHDDNANQNNQISPTQAESIASKLHLDGRYTPESVALNNTQTTTYIGKLTNYIKPIKFTISATDADGDQLVYSASNLPDGASFDPDTRTFSWTPRYDQAGVYSVHFEVSDGQLIDSEDVTITVIQLHEDWDVNGDGAANVLDMILVGQRWSETGLTGWVLEDTNEDGTINVLDIIIIGQHWTG